MQDKVLVKAGIRYYRVDYPTWRRILRHGSQGDKEVSKTLAAYGGAQPMNCPLFDITQWSQADFESAAASGGQAGAMSEQSQGVYGRKGRVVRKLI
jgi:hypothetical protein